MSERWAGAMRDILMSARAEEAAAGREGVK